MDEFTELLKKFEDSPDRHIEPPIGRVLVIDDDPNIRQGLERTLIQRNYSVVVTTNGTDGVDVLTDDINVVLLDVKLPKIDGTDVYELLKEKHQTIPIIFYSAFPGDDKATKKCLDLKPYAFIEKGVEADIDKLYSLIEKASKEGTR